MKNNIWFNKRFLAYALGLSIDRFGNAVYSIVLPLLAYSMTKSFIDMGVMAICQFFPRIIFGFFAGPLIDRAKKRNILFKALIFQSFCSMLIAILFQWSFLEMWMLYASGALLSIGFEFSRTAEISVVPEMFEDKKVDAITSLATIHTLMFIAGPTVGGLLLKFTSYGTLLWVNSLTYLGPIIFCCWSKIPNNRIIPKDKGLKTVLNDMKEGFQFLRKNFVLKKIMLITFFNGMATSGIQMMVLFYVKDYLKLNDSQTGLVLAVDGIGMLVGSIMVGRLKLMGRGPFLQICLCLNLTGSLLFLWPSTESLLIGQFLISVGTFSYLVSMDVIIQSLTPGHMLGRMAGLFRLFNYLIFVSSTACRSFFVSKIGIVNIFALSSFLILMAVVLAKTYFFGGQIKDSDFNFEKA
ncbi:MFS transporter [Bacteriovoracales bacterium]|nr:MFS transporter [Bacteriovoracales bacterium]